MHFNIYTVTIARKYNDNCPDQSKRLDLTVRTLSVDTLFWELNGQAAEGKTNGKTKDET